MAYWPKIIRNKPFPTLVAVATASLATWLVATLWGPVVWGPLAVVAIMFVALYPGYRRMREAHARPEADTFSFGDVVVRMRAKTLAEDALIAAKRRERILASP